MQNTHALNLAEACCRTNSIYGDFKEYIDIADDKI